MFRRIFLTAILAGFAAGLFLSLLQAVATLPLIHQAERYESAAPAHPRGADAGSGHVHEATAWAPAGGLERMLYTTLSNVLTAIGFALLLSAAFALHGRTVDGRRGVVWGLAGFFVFSAAPALGLPPELPGTMAAGLAARQGWWLATVGASGFGLWLLVFGRAAWQRGLAVLVLALPHLVGAPQPAEIGGPVPPELAGRFAAAALVTMALFWALLGWLAGTLYAHLRQEAASGAAELAGRAT